MSRFRVGSTRSWVPGRKRFGIERNFIITEARDEQHAVAIFECAYGCEAGSVQVEQIGGAL